MLFPKDCVLFLEITEEIKKNAEENDFLIKKNFAYKKK